MTLTEQALQPSLDVLSEDFAADPYPSYERFREEEPLYCDSRFGWIVSRFDDVTTVLSDPRCSTETYAAVEPLMGRTLLRMEGSEHARHRQMIAPFFKRDAVTARAVPLIRNIVGELVCSLQDEPAPDLVAGYAAQIPITTISRLLGLPEDGRPRFQAWYQAAAASTSNYAADPEVYETAVRTAGVLRDYLMPLIADRRTHPGDDLISAMCGATPGDGEAPLTDVEIANFSLLLLAAGGETTEKALTATLRNLLDYPHQRKMVVDGAVSVEDAIAESLRFRPPTHVVARLTTADVPLSIGTLPANVVVLCLIAAANRDPRRFSAPMRFDITRVRAELDPVWTNGAGHASFGSGRHFCAGSLLARAELEIAVTEILKAAPEIRYVDGFEPRESGLVTRGATALRVVGL